MWPHHVILNGYVCIFSNKIMPRPNGRHVDLVAFFLLLLFLSFSVLFLLSVSFFFFLVKYICGSTLKACQTFEIGFAIRKTRKVSTVLGALSCATKRWGGKRRAHTWIADAKWLKPKHTIIQRRQNWRHYFRFNHLCVCVCVCTTALPAYSGRCRRCHRSTLSFYSWFFPHSSLSHRCWFSWFNVLMHGLWFALLQLLIGKIY